MGEISADTRSKDTTNLLNYGFNSFKLNTIIDTNQELGKVRVEKGKKDYATVVLKENITEIVPINSKNSEYTYNLNINKVTAPIKNGDIIGTVEIIDNEGLIIREEQLTIKESIAKANIIDIFIKNIKNIITGKTIIK